MSLVYQELMNKGAEPATQTKLRSHSKRPKARKRNVKASTETSKVPDESNSEVKDLIDIDDDSDCQSASDPVAKAGSTTFSSMGRDGTNHISSYSFDKTTTKAHKLTELRTKIKHVKVVLEKESDADQRDSLHKVLAAWEAEEGKLISAETSTSALKIHSETSPMALAKLVGSFYEILRALLSLLNLVCDCEINELHHHICITFSAWWEHAKFIVQPDTINAFQVCYRLLNGVDCTAEALGVDDQKEDVLSVVVTNQSLSFLYLKMKKASQDLAAQLGRLGDLGKLKNVSEDCINSMDHLKTLEYPLQSLFADDELTEDVEEYMEILRISPQIFVMVEQDSRSWQPPETEYARVSGLLSDHDIVWKRIAGDYKPRYSKEIQGLEKALQLMEKR
jgi:hypothetical protein